MTSPDRVAQCAQLAMLFELSSSPKPGNVDRGHDFSDIGFHHFLVSAVSAYPLFRQAASGKGSIGSLLLDGVKAWREWHIRSNTHFGSLVLMIPLALASAKSGDLQRELAVVLRETTIQDAMNFYCAFELAGVRVADVAQFSLKDPRSLDKLRCSDQSLLDLMKLSAGHDLIAREWSTDYQRCFLLAGRLEQLIAGHGLNDGIVRAYLEALQEEPDSLVLAKFGPETAAWVARRAEEALQDPTLQAAEQLDLDLLAGDINPGSTADLIAASLFISLLNDLRF